MRKFLKTIILASAVALAGCVEATNLPREQPQEETDYSEIVFEGVPDSIDYASRDIQGILDYVGVESHNFVYDSDTRIYRKIEHWATPTEFFAKRRGDCEDFAITDLYLLRRDLDIEGEMILGKKKDASENNEGHAWIRVNGVYYESITGEPNTVTGGSFEEEYDISRVMSYENLMETLYYTSRGLEQRVVDFIIN